MRSRLAGSLLGYDVICPILLPPSSHLADLVIRYFHVGCLHAGMGITCTIFVMNIGLPDADSVFKQFYQNVFGARGSAESLMHTQEHLVFQKSDALGKFLSMKEWIIWVH